MRRNNTIYTMAVMALMIAIMCLFGFGPLANIRIGAIEITLLGLPVAIMACTFGAWGGLFAGLTWGIIAFFQGMLNGSIGFLEYSPFGYIMMCIVARVVTGFLAGLIYELIRKIDKYGYAASAVASVSVSVFNTLLFLSFYYLFFKNYADAALGSVSLGALIIAAVSINFVIEVSINAVAGTMASFGIRVAARKMEVTSLFPHIIKFDDSKFGVKKESTKENPASKSSDSSYITSLVDEKRSSEDTASHR